jgi:hypothetical protein
MIDLGSFLACHKFKIFLAMSGTANPFKPPKQKGAHIPLLAPPAVSLGWGLRRKSGHFFKQQFSIKNKCWGPK